MSAPALYNLIINASYFFLNAVFSALLVMAFLKRRDRVVFLFALASLLSIITSGCNLLSALLGALRLARE